jgi:hypothetical protein
METSLPTPTTTRVYVNLPEGNYRLENSNLSFGNLPEGN